MTWPINKIKAFFNQRKEVSREQRVLEYYEKNPGGLAGLVRDGHMVNKDKEARARQWVKEQEEKEKMVKVKVGRGLGVGDLVEKNEAQAAS